MYRLLFIWLLAVLLVGCSSAKSLNRHIYSIQKEHLDVTPFVIEIGPMYKRIASEQKFRALVLRKFYKEIYSVNDTIIVVELFGKMQLGYNRAINIVYRDTNYFYTKNFDTRGNQLIFRQDYIYGKDLTHSFDIQRQVRDSIRHELWNADPTHYGTDCRDADPVFITVLYPAGNIECLYARCWLTPEQIRGRQNR